jgi:N-acetylmuramoyl-L-alanine amidase
MRITFALSTMLSVAAVPLLVYTPQQTNATVSNMFEEQIIPEVMIQETLDLQEIERQKECIARNVYHEARNESKLGMRAVAWVTLNRIRSERYPNSACDVVHQANKDANGNLIKHKCQFSWYCDGKADVIKNEEAWKTANEMVDIVVANYLYVPDPTDGATMYHANYVSPYWKKDYEKTTRIDSHIFYK